MNSKTKPSYEKSYLVSNNFVAPYNGYICGYNKRETGTLYAYVNNIKVAEYNQNHSYGCTNVGFPIGKGQTLTYTGNWNWFNFVPYA